MTEGMTGAALALPWRCPELFDWDLSVSTTGTFEHISPSHRRRAVGYSIEIPGYALFRSKKGLPFAETGQYWNSVLILNTASRPSHLNWSGP